MPGLGNWLPERIVKVKLRSKAELARRSGVAAKTLDRMQQGLHMPQVSTLRALEPHLRAKAEDVERIFRGEIDDTPLLPEAGAVSPSNLQRVGEIPLHPAPLHRDLFASRFRQEPQPGGESVSLPVAADFVAIVAGNCMSPLYPPGCMVGFNYSLVERGKPDVGRDYYVLMKNQEITFKRLTKVDAKTLTFECINPEMPDRQPITVLKDDVERMARAVWRGWAT